MKNTWIIVKPETLLWLKPELENFLIKNNYHIKKIYPIKDWDKLSIDLYKQSDKVTKGDLILQNIGRFQILRKYSNCAEVWILKSSDNSIIGDFENLNNLKYLFRRTYWEKNLNMYFEFNGKMTIYHFTFFHVPDPIETKVSTEWDIIKNYIG